MIPEGKHKATSAPVVPKSPRPACLKREPSIQRIPRHTPTVLGESIVWHRRNIVTEVHRPRVKPCPSSLNTSARHAIMRQRPHSGNDFPAFILLRLVICLLGGLSGEHLAGLGNVHPCISKLIHQAHNGALPMARRTSANWITTLTLWEHNHRRSFIRTRCMRTRG